ncbi:expressed unknown protein [Seminavis robusta]|uniref:Uncharacterized protein n=1 Tax=Seminavis robusta TaxID=568900 RepID=A0A9N8HGG8_9STRA|nr:expressed unknown protein [Seminavis robusta]|eukprot:Sro484_g152200.1 n/a (155) ;mRNA; r:14997-15461
MKSKEEKERQEHHECEEEFVVTWTEAQGQSHCPKESSKTLRPTDASSSRAVSCHGLHHSKEDMNIKLSAAAGLERSNKMGAESQVGAVPMASSGRAVSHHGLHRSKEDMNIKLSAAAGLKRSNKMGAESQVGAFQWLLPAGLYLIMAFIAAKKT